MIHLAKPDPKTLAQGMALQVLRDPYTKGATSEEIARLVWRRLEAPKWAKNQGPTLDECRGAVAWAKEFCL